MKTSTVLAALLFLGAASPAFGIVRCVDPNTGAVTFTERGCDQGQGERVRLHGGNVMDSGHLRSEIQRQQLEETRELERQTSVQPQASARRVSAGEDRACQEAARPHKGAHGLTAAQRRVLARCAGATVPEDNANTTPPPMRGPAPSVITSCDAAGCWDNQGGRYNKGAGSTYFHQSGKPCQLQGGLMQCP